MSELSVCHDTEIVLPAIDESQVALGPIDSLPLGQGRCISLGGLKVAVFRQRDGSVFAIEAACPHLGGPLADGLVGSGIVVCPLHAYRFRLSDGAGIDTDLKVRTFKVQVRDGLVFLKLPQAE